jgi:hypothetical protein
MPRSLTNRNVMGVIETPTDPDKTAQWVPLMFPPRGMNTSGPLPRLSKDTCRLVEDMVFYDGTYKSRDGTKVLGTSSVVDLIHAQEFVLSNGESYMLRMTPTAVEWYSAGTWIAAAGPALLGNITAAFSFTGWNDTVVFTNDTGHLGVVEFSTGVPVVSLLTNSPLNVTHITTFSKRIIASKVDGVYWCVKGDNTDWSGLGSGYEDFLASPGGVLEGQAGVVPITDQLAFVIRSNSIRSMRPTQDFDAPFEFEELYANVGSVSPMTIARTRNGAIFVSRDSVVLANAQGVQDIGKPIRRSLSFKPTSLRYASGAFDPRENTYRLIMQDSSGNNKSWRYNLEQDIWTKDNLKFEPRSVSFTRLTQAKTVDEIFDIVDDVEDAIDDFGLVENVAGAIYTSTIRSGPRFVLRDSIDAAATTMRDVDDTGGTVPSGFRFETGYILAAKPFDKTELLYVDIEYESSHDIIGKLDYSIDGGATWKPFSTRTLATTVKSTVARFVGRVNENQFQIALSSDIIGTFRLHGLYTYITGGAEVEDAS